MNIHNNTQSVVFLYSRFSLFLKDQFFQIFNEKTESVKMDFFQNSTSLLSCLMYKNAVSHLINQFLNLYVAIFIFKRKMIFTNTFAF